MTAKYELNSLFTLDETGEILTFELVELSDDEVNNMDEFQGW